MRAVSPRPCAAACIEFVARRSRKPVECGRNAAAPPPAQDAILVVADSSVELGQLGKRFPGGRGQAWLIGGALLTAAVVLPIIDNGEGSADFEEPPVASTAVVVPDNDDGS